MHAPRGNGSRRRRGRHVGIPWRRVGPPVSTKTPFLDAGRFARLNGLLSDESTPLKPQEAPLLQNEPFKGLCFVTLSGL